MHLLGHQLRIVLTMHGQTNIKIKADYILVFFVHTIAFISGNLLYVYVSNEMLREIHKNCGQNARRTETIVELGK